jgi:hypothetical protein
LPHLLAIAGIAAGAAVTLRSMGRTVFCTCGRVSLWTSDTWGPENSQQLFDPYTFTHVTHGILLYLLVRFAVRRSSPASQTVLVVAIEAAWEILENTNAVIDRYRAATMALGYYGDSVVNSVGDILACILGAALAARLSPRASLALALVLEIVLTVWIRDSLVLNVLMLIYPLEGVRQWQLGKG